MSTIESVAVIGAGTMGAGIAQVFLQYGYTVVLVDKSQEQLATAGERIQQGLQKLAEKDALDEPADALYGNLHTSVDMADVAGADLILEVVPEKLDIKQRVFADAAQHNADALYASNTSSLSIETLSASAPDPSRVIGMHFFNPPHVMDIVELVTTDQTADETLHTAEKVVESLDKHHSVVKDSPGFVANRILMPLLNEAMKTLEEQVASKEDIDRLAEHGLNHPMGPLKLADFIGLDVCLDIMQSIYRERGDERFRPADILEEKVEQGDLGKKSGKGFYTY